MARRGGDGGGSLGSSAVAEGLCSLDESDRPPLALYYSDVFLKLNYLAVVIFL